MIIRLLRNYSDSNVVSKNVENVIELTGTLKEGTSVTDPTITLELSTDNAPSFNYMHIPEFGRYYFVTGIDSVRNNLWSISGHVDVLMSYNKAIRNQKAVIARQENLYNLYLDDDKLLVTSKRNYTTKVFPNDAPSGGCFILCLAGAPESV